MNENGMKKNFQLQDAINGGTTALQQLELIQQPWQKGKLESKGEKGDFS